MQQLLLISILLLGSFAQGQTFHGDVRPITDYNQCYTGFVNGSGDTIWPMQFQKVAQADVYYNDYSYQSLDQIGWIVMYEDRYGVIDRQGLNSISFEYTSIKPVRNGNASYFIIEQEEKFGVCDRNGNVLIPPRFEEIYSNGYNKYGFYENGLVGQFDSKFEVIIPARFDYIEYRWEDYYEYNDTTSRQRFFTFYETHLDDKKGLFDTLGNEVVPSLYHDIELIYPHNECTFDLKYFHVNRDQKWGVYELGKGEIIPTDFDDLHVYYLFDDCNSPSTPVLHGINRNHKKKRNLYYLIDLKTGEVSDPYDGLYYYQDGLSFTERKGLFGIVDSTFRPVVAEIPYTFTTYAMSIEGYYTKFRKKDDLLLISEYARPKENYHYYPDHVVDQKKGLYRLSTEAYTEVIYDRIEVHHADDQTFYWAYIDKKLGSNSLTIYDQDLNVVKEMDVHQIEGLNRPDIESFLIKDPIYIIQNKEDKWGILDASGKELIPFEYVSYDDLSRQRCDTSRLMLQLPNGKQGVFDEFGNVLTPAIYDSVICDCDGVTIGIRDGLFDGYLWQKRVIEKAEHISITRVLNYNHSSEYDRIGERQAKTSFYIVQEDTLYIYENDSLKRMDRKRSRFDRPIQVFDGRYLVNQFGRIIAHGNYTMRSLGNLATYHNIHETVLIDEQGNILLKLDGYYYIYQQGVYYYAKHDGKVGILHPETFEWLIEPKYADLDPIRNVSGFFFLARISRGDFGSYWQVLNEKGELAIPYAIDHAIYFKVNEPAVFSSEGKKGLLSNAMEVLIEPNYEAVFRLNDTYWLRSNLLWGAWRKGKPILEPQFPNVSAIHNGNKFVAITADRNLVFIDRDLSISAPKRYESLLHSDELRDFFGKTRYNLSVVGNHPYQYRRIIDSLDTLINNYSTLLLIYSNTFQLLNNYIHHDVLNYYYSNNRRQQMDYRVYHTYIYMPRRSGRYYSFQQIDGRAIIDPRYDYDLHRIQTSEVRQKRIFTIDLTDPSLDAIQLEDLFIENSRWDAALDSALTQEINEKQLFGVTCVDLNGILKEFKRNFYVNDGGLLFSRNSYLSGPNINVPYEALKNYLKHPEDFGL